MHTRFLGLVDYHNTYEAMKSFTANRSAETVDELWICEHPSVYTQGISAHVKTIDYIESIPVINTDRGGQITYHGKGQIMAYLLIDLRRKSYFVKEYVRLLEESVCQLLTELGLTGLRIKGAPGVYVATPQIEEALTAFSGIAKIAALGVRVTGHCTYHGLALNVAMDLSPFLKIHPCGYETLKVTDLKAQGVQLSYEEIAHQLARHLQNYLG